MELLLVGLFVGLLSGFFGIGGGTILVPLLLFLGFDIKSAIEISVVQMVFSSIFGSYINNKKGTLDIALVSFIGFGGSVGAFFSGYLTDFFAPKTLQIIFLIFAIFALFRVFFKPKNSKKTAKKPANLILFLIGVPIGAISMTIGVGGSIILVPILVGFLHIPLKEATSAGLFFVIFSSISGFVSHFGNGMDIYSGALIGLASLFGVYFGIELKHKVKSDIQKTSLLIFYLLVVVYLIKKTFL